MIHDREVEHFGILDRAAHELVALHAFAIVGHGHDARILELPRWSELFAVHADSQATCCVDSDDCLSLDLIHNALDGARVVADRARVGHTNHAGETACGGRFRAAADVFLMRLPGISEMHVDVDEPRRHDEAFGIDHGGFGLLRIAQTIDDFSIDGENLADRVALIGRVDDPSVLYPKYVCHDEI